MNTKSNKECPDYEDVSAFVDGELKPESAEFSHIQSCDKCQKRIEQYKKLNDSISGALQAAVPDGFAENMLADIKNRQEKSQNKKVAKPIPFNLFMKAAAMFLLVGAGVFIINKEGFLGKSFDPETPEPLVFLNKPEPMKNLSKLEFHPTRKNASIGNNSIDIRNLMNVSSGNYNDAGLFDINKDSGGCVACIKPEVSQVWSVDDLAFAEKEFAKFANNSKFAKDKNGNGVTVINLSKKELAELVRKCKAAGFRLLTASQPQPEQTTFSGNKDDKVCYTATLIQAE